MRITMLRMYLQKKSLCFLEATSDLNVIWKCFCRDNLDLQSSNFQIKRQENINENRHETFSAEAFLEASAVGAVHVNKQAK